MPALTYDSIVVGQGLAGSAVAWRLFRQGDRTLIIDAGEHQTASKIAAGLIMPISGRRMAEWANYAELLALSTLFYSQVEELVQASFFHGITIERLFQDQQQREEYERRASSFRTVTTLNDDRTGFLMAGARLNVPAYLLATRRHFESLEAYQECRLDVEKDLRITADGVSIERLDVKARRIFFCQGHEGAKNPWFPSIPDRPVRGEILKVSVSDSPPNVLCTDYWLAPALQDSHDNTVRKSDHLLVGATYDRLNLTSGPTEESVRTLQEFVQQVTGQSATIIDQYSGVRASTANRQIVVEQHKDHANVIVVNGLGSRGSLLAPLAAQKAIELSQRQVGESVDSKKQKHGKSVTQLAHNIHRRNLKPGDQVLDATAGNGHDTLFLARIVGSENVTAMDLQQEALESARARLTSENHGGVRWLLGDHAILMEQLERDGHRFRAIVFNLGYLPGGDKTIVTQQASTARAITVAERLLDDGGVMTVVAYPGHDAGREEEQFLRSEASRRATSEKPIDRIAGNEDDPQSPVLYVYRS